MITPALSPTTTPDQGYALTTLTAPTTIDTPAPAAPPFLPTLAVADAALSPGVRVTESMRYASKFAPPLLLPSGGGYNGASRFVSALIAGTFVAAATTTSATPDASSTSIPLSPQTPLLTVTAAQGSRALESAHGGRDTVSVYVPGIGNLGVSGGGYEVGSVDYPLASLGGVIGTFGISLAALLAVAAALGAAGLARNGLVRHRMHARAAAAAATRRREPTREALYREATRQNIRGRSRMSKAELQRALEDR